MRKRALKAVQLAGQPGMGGKYVGKRGKVVQMTCDEVISTKVTGVGVQGRHLLCLA